MDIRCGDSSVFNVSAPVSEGEPRYSLHYTKVDVWKAMVDLLGDQTNSKSSVPAADKSQNRFRYVWFPHNREKPGYDVLSEYRNPGLIPLETTTKLTFTLPGMNFILSQPSRNFSFFISGWIETFFGFKKLITVNRLLSCKEVLLCR